MLNEIKTYLVKKLMDKKTVDESIAEALKASGPRVGSSQIFKT